MTVQNIVLVDDDQEDGEFFMEAIGQIDRSIDVYVAESEADLLDSIRRRIPDMLFIDSFLQDQRGSDVVGRIKQMPEFASLVVVMYTGAMDGAATKRAFDAGAHCYIVKPPTHKEVKQVLGTVINAARSGDLSQLKHQYYSDGKFSPTP